MSMETHTVSGRGFKIQGITHEKKLQFIKNHKNAIEELNASYIMPVLNTDINNPDELENLLVYFEENAEDSTGMSVGFGVLISNVIFEETGIYMEYRSGMPDMREHDECVMLPNLPPWEYNEKEKELEEKQFDAILMPYITELGLDVKPENIRVEYLE